ncbi:MAG: radical SAM protein [Candidatus Omnitrophica bacterium]|nr:radical SAM protein [Candidatus Omnitrophota bacterium]
MLGKISFKENRRRYLNLKGILSRKYAYKGPDIVQIDLTDKCNSHCNVCWLHSPCVDKDPGRQFDELDYNILKDFIEEIAFSGTKEIIFSGGGEPFLYSRIWGVLEHAQKTGLDFRLNTNLTLLDKDGIKRLVSLKNLVSLTASIWAGSAQEYCGVHNRSVQDFDKVRGNLKDLNALKHRRLEIKLYAVISNVNHRALKSVVDLALKNGCRIVEFGIFDAIPGATDRFLLTGGQLGALQKDFKDLLKHANTVRIANAGIFLRRISNPLACYGEYDTGQGRIPCYAGWLFLRLRANGDFNSCLKSHRMPLGNIYRDKFHDIWNGFKQQEFRRKGCSSIRDWAYFGLMGNAHNDRGCRIMCDNILLNQNIHKFMRYMFSQSDAEREVCPVK